MISSVARDTRTQRAEKREGEAQAEPYTQPERERKEAGILDIKEEKQPC